MLELYHSWDSFCSFKVRLCLEEKGLAWTGHHLDLMKFENLRPDYLRLNPAGVVPTLVDNGAVVVESSFINEYLDDTFPEVSLRPESPYEKARMRVWLIRSENEALAQLTPRQWDVAVEIYRGRRSGVSKVDVLNQDDKLVAVFRGRSSILRRELLGKTGN